MLGVSLEHSVLVTYTGEVRGRVRGHLGTGLQGTSNTREQQGEQPGDNHPALCNTAGSENMDNEIFLCAFNPLVKETSITANADMPRCSAIKVKLKMWRLNKLHQNVNLIKFQ